MNGIIKIDNKGWARCSKCGHKLFKLNCIQSSSTSMSMEMLGLEIKCHSCKQINVLRGVNNND